MVVSIVSIRHAVETAFAMRPDGTLTRDDPFSGAGPKHVAVYLCVRLRPDLSYRQIASAFCLTTSGSCVNSLTKVDQHLRTDDWLRARISAIASGLGWSMTVADLLPPPGSVGKRARPKGGRNFSWRRRFLFPEGESPATSSSAPSGSAH